MWSYVFVLDNGTKVYVNYTWMYVPTQGFKIGTDFSAWNFKGKSYIIHWYNSVEKKYLRQQLNLKWIEEHSTSAFAKLAKDIMVNAK